MKTIKQKLFLILVLFMILLSACQPATEATVEPVNTATTAPLPTEAVEPTATPEPTPTTTPLPLNGQQTQYDIDLTINYYNQYISAVSRTKYTNKSNTPIGEMVFIVYPTYFSGTYGNVIYIKSVHLAGTAEELAYRWEGTRMIIPLDTPLQPGETIEFVHEFELYMPEREGVFGQTGRQLSLAYWYPFIPPFSDEDGWLAHDMAQVNGLIVGDSLVFEAADFNVNLQFTDRRENLQIAAGALPEEADGILHFSMPLARTFTFVISDRYSVFERDVDGVLVRSYAFAEDAHAGEAAADLAAQSIELYSQLFGPYDREVYNVVEADIGIGMEFDGLVLMLSSFYWYYNDTPQTDLTIIVPHETAHQWFFSMVGNDQAMEGWLDESMATYSEALFYENYYPDELEWWWDVRVNDHLPWGYIDNTIYLAGGVPDYFDTVYRVGALFHRDLRAILGDDAYFTFLQDYVQKYKHELVTKQDFWSMVTSYTDADLTDLYIEYFQYPLD